MALFGNGGRNRQGSGLMPTREDLGRQRQFEAIFGNNPLGPASGQVQQSPPQLPDLRVAEQPQPQRSIDPDVLAMIGSAPQRKGNTGRDILAGALAAFGDTFSQRGGGNGGAVEMLANTWGGRRTKYDSDLQAFQTRDRIGHLPGMNAREMAAFMADPKAWASSMASNATSRFGAATLNPGDTRFLGEGNGSVQAPTRGQQYAGALGLRPGSDPYNTALRDQELGANGPTAFGNTQALEGLRQLNRLRLDRQRQDGRASIRGAPTYRDLNPPTARASAARQPSAAPHRSSRPTATGPNGERVEWDGKQWVEAR
jgi:hypothetical protein